MRLNRAVAVALDERREGTRAVGLQRGVARADVNADALLDENGQLPLDHGYATSISVLMTAVERHSSSAARDRVTQTV